MKRKLVLVIVGAILVLGMAGAGVAVWTSQQKDDALRESRDLERSTEEVDDVLTQIWDRLAMRDDAWEEISDSRTGMASLVNFTVEDIKTVRTQAAEARTLAEQIPSAEVRDAYLAVCDELDTAFKDAEATAADVKPYVDASTLLDQALNEELSGGSFNLNQAVQANNDEQWDQAKEYAGLARTEYQHARDAFTQVASSSGVPQVNDAIPVIDIQLQMCDVQAQAADAGRARKTSKFNELVARYNTLRKSEDDQSYLLYEADRVVKSKARQVFPPLEPRAEEAKKLWEKAQGLAATVG